MFAWTQTVHTSHEDNAHTHPTELLLKKKLQAHEKNETKIATTKDKVSQSNRKTEVALFQRQTLSCSN